MIRLPGETDAEYEHRTRPMMRELSETLARHGARQILELYKVDHRWQQWLKLAALRRSCGVTDSGTFKWHVPT